MLGHSNLTEDAVIGDGGYLPRVAVHECGHWNQRVRSRGSGLFGDGKEIAEIVNRSRVGQVMDVAGDVVESEVPM